MTETNIINTEENETAFEFYERICNGIKKKANVKKNESILFYIISISSSLLATLFISLGEGYLLGKIIPASLSVISAFSVSWLQLRKPQHLWALYRTAQRELEDNSYKYIHKIDEYARSKNPDKLLAKKVSEISLELHYNWLAFVPKSENVKITSHGI